MGSWVGYTFTLWKIDYELLLYVDQMGISRSGNRVLREVEVTVTEEKFVPGQIKLEQEQSPYALKAVVADGEEFFNNWQSDPEKNSYGPLGKSWYTLVDGEYGFYENAIDHYNMRGIANVTPGGERAIPAGIKICEPHGKAFAPRDEGTHKGCHECYLDTIRPVEPPKATAGKS
jgi:hypothetical protein